MLNEACFAAAETNPAAAYWIGFLMADGCINHHPTTGNYGISVGLKLEDSHHLEKLLAFMGSDKEVAIRKRANGGYSMVNYAQVCVYSKLLVESVARYGLLPRKSHAAKVELLQNSRDFWRGMIDGDGSIGIWGTVYKKPAISLCGSKATIVQFVEFCSRISSAFVNVLPDKSIWKTRVAGAPAWDVIRHLYHNAAESLDRKQLIADEIIAAGRPIRKKLVRSKPSKPRVYAWLTSDMIRDAIGRTDSLRGAARDLGVPWSAFHGARKRLAGSGSEYNF